MLGFTRDLMKAKLRAHYGAPATETIDDLLKRYKVDNPTFTNQAAHKQYYMTKLTILLVAFSVTETVEDLAEKYWNAYS